MKVDGLKDQAAIAGARAGAARGGRRTAAPARKVDKGPLPELIGYAIRRSQIAVFQDFMRSMGEAAVRPAQFSILTVIARNPGLKQAQVSATLGIERARLVLVLNELEARGLAKRVASKTDRRSHALYLTPEGEAVLADLNRRVAEHEARMTVRLGPAGKRQLLELLARLHQD